jgi:hypothetical protein
MKTYKLTQIADFPTRITNSTETLLHISFVNTTVCTKKESIPFINGLSDHDAQTTCLHQISTATEKEKIEVIQQSYRTLFSKIVTERNMGKIIRCNLHK